jgi:hypothetical protein
MSGPVIGTIPPSLIAGDNRIYQQLSGPERAESAAVATAF